MSLRLLTTVTLVFASTLTAQTAPRSLTIRSNTQLVLIPVIVRKKSGKGFPGLRKEEFRVFEDGKPRPITLFDEVRTRATAEPISSTAPKNTRRPATPTGGLPIALIVLDQINTPYADQQNVRDEMVKFWSDHRNIPAATALYVLRKNRIRVVQPLTTDTSLLISQMKNIKSDLDMRGAGVTGELPLPQGAQSTSPPVQQLTISLRSRHVPMIGTSLQRTGALGVRRRCWHFSRLLTLS